MTKANPYIENNRCRACQNRFASVHSRRLVQHWNQSVGSSMSAFRSLLRGRDDRDRAKEYEAKRPETLDLPGTRSRFAAGDRSADGASDPVRYQAIHLRLRR